MDQLNRYTSFDSDSARWWEFEMRPGDIVISTPSKSGTTWMQTLCGLLIFDGPDFPDRLERMSPWLDHFTEPMVDVAERLGAQEHRRFIKTHTPLDGVPIHRDATYVMVGRDPRDAAVSLMHHSANIDRAIFSAIVRAVTGEPAPGEADSRPEPPPPAERLRQFVESDEDLSTAPITLAGMLDHLRSGWELRHRGNVHLFHYADLKRDLPLEMSILAGVLGVDAGSDRIEELAEHATLDSMRARSSRVIPEATMGFWKDPKAFLRSGATGEWRELMSDSDIARYWERVSQLSAPDLASWAHEGRAALR